MPGYRDSREHLYDELRRIDLLLNAQVARQRLDPAYAGFNEFRGLFITEAEVDQALADKPQKPQAADQTEAETLANAARRLETGIAHKAAEREPGVELPLLRVADLFQLSPFDLDALLLCLAPELDLKYEKLYAYLQNDVTRKRPSVDLILNLLCRSLDEKIMARRRLGPNAPLFKHQLLHYAGDTPPAQTALLARFVKLDQRILNLLLGVWDEEPDEQLSPLPERITPRATWSELILPAELKERLTRTFQTQTQESVGSDAAGASIFLFHGPAGAGKRLAAEALCQSAGLNLFSVDLPRFLLTADPARTAAWLLREAILQAAPIYFDGAEALLDESERVMQARPALFGALSRHNGLIFFGSQQPWPATMFAPPGFYLKAAFPAPSCPLRRQIWRQLLAPEQPLLAGDVDANALADKFNFTAGQIHRAIADAKQTAATREPDQRRVTTADLAQSCRAQSTARLMTLARKITPLYNWRDITLPADRLAQLREVCAHVKHRQQVFGEWGFDRKVSLGKGLGILFIGPSGTGKTMAAEIVAGELGLDLYKIDLSCVISKYIGETEKNLSRIFAEAEQSNAILFFDEADAIFGKRSEVKDSHDRYANIEVNYLLQRIEEYEGTVILASNFQKNIDEAFTRRLRFVIEFPFPEEEDRRRIWQQIFPAGAPMDAGVDFNFLARKFKFSGGNIRNVALNAAFLAAQNGGLVSMEHVIHATKREFQKTGKLCVKADFEQYFDLVRGKQEAA